jgi:hypothetical protein
MPMMRCLHQGAEDARPRTHLGQQDLLGMCSACGIDEQVHHACSTVASFYRLLPLPFLLVSGCNCCTSVPSIHPSIKTVQFLLHIPSYRSYPEPLKALCRPPSRTGWHPASAVQVRACEGCEAVVRAILTAVLTRLCCHVGMRRAACFKPVSRSSIKVGRRRL